MSHLRKRSSQGAGVGTVSKAQKVRQEVEEGGYFQFFLGVWPQHAQSWGPQKVPL